MGTGRVNFLKNNGGPARPVEERFWEKVEIRGEDDCWEWLASVGRDGYGCFQSGLAHRFSWIFTYGEIQNKLYVCHSCDNPICVNPKHLFLGTQLDNMKDMVSKGRVHDNRGEGNPKAKLMESDVMEIYRLSNSGITNTEISRRFGVTKTSINYIVSGKTWKHLWEKVTHV